MMREVAASGWPERAVSGALRRQGTRGISAEYVRFETGRLGILARRGPRRGASLAYGFPEELRLLKKAGSFPDFLMHRDETPGGVCGRNSSNNRRQTVKNFRRR